MRFETKVDCFPNVYGNLITFAEVLKTFSKTMFFESRRESKVSIVSADELAVTAIIISIPKKPKN